MIKSNDKLLIFKSLPKLPIKSEGFDSQAEVLAEYILNNHNIKVTKSTLKNKEEK